MSSNSNPVLFYVMGASGAGKDSLLEQARLRLPAVSHLLFAHRYINRPPDHGAENHVAVSDREFELLLETGCFAMHWRAHGFSYGIGVEIGAWLDAGLSVVVSGSRAYGEQACRLFSNLLPVLIDVPDSRVRERLAARRRESEEEIGERIARNRLLAKPSLPRMVTIDNSGDLNVAVSAFLDLVLG